MSARDLRAIETLTLTPRTIAGLNGTEDEETYKIVGVKILSGDGIERIVVLRTASGDEIVLLRSATQCDPPCGPLCAHMMADKTLTSSAACIPALIKRIRLIRLIKLTLHGVQVSRRRHPP